MPDELLEQTIRRYRQELLQYQRRSTAPAEHAAPSPRTEPAPPKKTESERQTENNLPQSNPHATPPENESRLLGSNTEPNDHYRAPAEKTLPSGDPREAPAENRTAQAEPAPNEPAQQPLTLPEQNGSQASTAPQVGDAMEPLLCNAAHTDSGRLVVAVTTARQSVPLIGADVTISRTRPEGDQLYYFLTTDQSGETNAVSLPAPPAAQSESPGLENPYAVYRVQVSSAGFIPEERQNVQIFASVESRAAFNLIPDPSAQQIPQFPFMRPLSDAAGKGEPNGGVHHS